MIPNCAESIRKLIKKLGPAHKFKSMLRSRTTGSVVYCQLAELVECTLSSGNGKSSDYDKKELHSVRRVDPVTPYKAKALTEFCSQARICPANRVCVCPRGI